MALPVSYYPSWWNINDGRTSHLMGYGTSKKFHDRSQKKKRCFNGHFGRVGACGFHFTNGKFHSQFSIDHDIFPIGSSVPIFAGDSKNNDDIVLGQQKKDLVIINKSGNSLVASAASRGDLKKHEETLGNLRRSLLNRQLDDSVELCKHLPERTSTFLQDSEAAEVMWNEERLSNALSPVNYAFTGGCLVSQSMENHNETALLHPCGENLQSVKRHVYYTDEKTLSDNSDSLTMDSPVCEMDIRKSLTPNVVVRCLSNSLSFIQSDANGYQLLERKDFDFLKRINSVRLSPYSCTDYVITANNQVYLFDQSRNDPIYTSDTFNSLIHSFREWCFSCFTNNLWNLLFLDNSMFRLIDTRQPGGSLELFSITNEAIYSHGEVFTSIVSRPELLGDYHIITSNNNMVMLDQRMPQRPVLQWTNSLIGQPSTGFIAGDHDLLWYVAGCQRKKDICVNYINLRSGSMLPPQLLASNVGSAPDNFKDSLHNSLNQIVVSERFCNTSLLSICVLPNIDDHSMDCLLLFSNGDITRQTFRLESSASDSLTLSAAESSKSDKWLDSVIRSKVEMEGSHSCESVGQESDICFSDLSVASPLIDGVSKDMFYDHIGAFSQSSLNATAHSQLLAFDLERFLQSSIGECGTVVDDSMTEKKLFALRKRRIHEESSVMSLNSSQFRKEHEEAKIGRLADKKLRR